ncbi:response regulator [Cryptosporangium japonicum]|uniref:Response regulatory domain-containing protein n=1 Tax=Cryptosporangium japonicum TaxID=80872 RepID=A0ABN0UD91_9ACTN
MNSLDAPVTAARADRTTSLVLVIEDEPDLLAMFQRALVRSGFDVVIATNGREGLAAAAELRPDLVVLDIVMPGESGFRVCQQLRRGEATSSTPVLLLSAAPTETNVAQGRQAGATGFLAKPLSPAMLAEHVRGMLDNTVHPFSLPSGIG